MPLRTAEIDPADIGWIETSGGTVRVRTAALVSISYGEHLDPEPGYEVTCTNGSRCYIPLRAVLRVDLRR